MGYVKANKKRAEAINSVKGGRSKLIVVGIPLLGLFCIAGVVTHFIPGVQGKSDAPEPSGVEPREARTKRTGLVPDSIPKGDGLGSSDALKPDVSASVKAGESAPKRRVEQPTAPNVGRRRRILFPMLEDSDIDQKQILVSRESVNRYSSNGKWGERDFRILEFAGFAFGSDAYSGEGDEWVRGNVICDKEGKFCPVGVTRISTLWFAEPLFGFDEARAHFTYETRQLAEISFNRYYEDSDEGYATAADNFYKFLETMRTQYGLMEPDIEEEVASNGRKNLQCSMHAGESSFTVYIQKDPGPKSKLHMYASVFDPSLSNLMRSEGEAAVANPPTERIRAWVEKF